VGRWRSTRVSPSHLPHSLINRPWKASNPAHKIVYIPRLIGIFHNNINSCFGGVVNAYDSNFQHYDIIFLRERRFESCRQLIFFLPISTNNSPSTHAGDVVWKWVEFGSSGVRGRFERSDSSESSVKPECYHGTATTMTSTRVLEQNNNGDVFPSKMRTNPLRLSSHRLVVPPACQPILLIVSSGQWA
jgi:hypothetical protein